MKADPGAQRRLLDLQQVDTAVAQLQHRRASLSQHAEIKQLHARHVELGDALTAAATRVSDLERAQQRAEKDLEPVRARLARDRQRLDSGTATSDPKALTGLLDEIQSLIKRISDLEDAELDVMERLEAATSERDAASAQRAEVDGRLRELLARRDEQLRAIDAELAELGAEREAQVAVLPADLVGLYDKIRLRSGAGAAALQHGRCTGCQLEANAADLRRYTAASPDEVLRCEECGRILVR